MALGLIGLLLTLVAITFAREQLLDRKRTVYCTTAQCRLNRPSTIEAAVVRALNPAEIQDLHWIAGLDAELVLFHVVLTLKGHEFVAERDSDTAPTLTLEFPGARVIAFENYIGPFPGVPSLASNRPAVSIIQREGDLFDVTLHKLPRGEVVSLYGIAASLEGMGTASLETVPTSRVPDLFTSVLTFAHYGWLGPLLVDRYALPEKPEKVPRSLLVRQMWQIAKFFLWIYILFSLVADLRRLDAWQQWEDIYLYLDARPDLVASVAHGLGVVFFTVALGICGLMAAAIVAWALVDLVVFTVNRQDSNSAWRRLQQRHMKFVLENGPLGRTDARVRKALDADASFESINEEIIHADLLRIIKEGAGKRSDASSSRASQES